MYTKLYTESRKKLGMSNLSSEIIKLDIYYIACHINVPKKGWRHKCCRKKAFRNRNVFLTTTINLCRNHYLYCNRLHFNQCKKILTSDAIVKYFDPDLVTCLLTNASRLKGIGYALVQYDKDDKIRLISCGSHSLNSAEQNYATIEL